MIEPANSNIKKEVQIARRQAADYAMAMDALAKISQLETEEESILGVLKFSEMLFIPKTLYYVSFAGHQSDKTYSLAIPGQHEATTKQPLDLFKEKYSLTESKKGFQIKIGFGDTDFGILVVDDVEYPDYVEHYLNLMISITSICGLSIQNAKRYQIVKEVGQKLQKEKETLEEAMANIKTLKGLLPICSYCKKIRDDKGYWDHVENYIQKHSDASLSHSICRDCAKKHYPDYNLYDDENP